MNKKEKPITSSLGFYCFACTILTGINAGVNNVFWVYLLLTIIFSGTTAYLLYRSSKANHDNSVTYYFFSGDYLGLGLLMITFYLDYHMHFINIDQGTIVKMLLVIGIMFVIGSFIKMFKK